MGHWVPDDIACCIWGYGWLLLLALRALAIICGGLGCDRDAGWGGHRLPRQGQVTLRDDLWEGVVLDVGRGAKEAEIKGQFCGQGSRGKDGVRGRGVEGGKGSR